jgi:hypothetical protein
MIEENLRLIQKRDAMTNEQRLTAIRENLPTTRLSQSTGSESASEFYRPTRFVSRNADDCGCDGESRCVKHGTPDEQALQLFCDILAEAQGEPLPTEPESELERARR